MRWRRSSTRSAAEGPHELSTPAAPYSDLQTRPEPPPGPEPPAGAEPAQRLEPPLHPEPTSHPERPTKPALPTRAPDRPFVGPLEAGLRHSLLVALPVVLLLAAGLAIGLARSPTYTAQADINVGRVDVPAYTLQGVVSGDVVLAASYARAGDAPAVIRPAARASGVTSDEARSRLDVSPVLGTTLVQVEARGPTERAAITLSNAAARSLISYAQNLNNQQFATGLLPQYRSALAQVARTRARLARLNASKTPDPVSIQQAQLDLSTAQLKAQSFSSEYLNQGGLPAPDDLQLITSAVRATSDRTSVLERLLLAGLAAGLVIGLLLAVARANAGLMTRRRVD